MNETARRWLVFSNEDLRMAELALSERLWNQTCFHSRQSDEKALIAERGDSIPRMHRLTDMMSLTGGRVREELEDELLSLEGFYIPTRYPDAMPGSLSEGSPEERDATEALAAARKVVGVVRELMDQSST